MNIAIIEFPGTNCERESAMAVRRAGMNPVSFRWNAAPELLHTCDGYIIAGGFSYEDRSRSGIIAALDPLLPLLKREADAGKPVLGICNGAQILVEAGMVPNTEQAGAENIQIEAALARNRRIEQGVVLGTGFYNAWVTIRYEGAPKNSAFSSRFSNGAVMTIPAAHAEGRFIVPEKTLHTMIEKHMTVFRYTNEQGAAIPDFPINPNGSVYNLAGICNPAGNVLALMPHPERTPAGDALFLSMRDYISQEKEISLPSAGQTATPAVTPQTGNEALPVYQKAEDAEELSIDLIITDNAAVSVENALRQKGIPASVSRKRHWEIIFDKEITQAERSAILERAEATGELYNPNKELPLRLEKPAGLVQQKPCCDTAASSARSYLITPLPGEDSVGEHTLHALKEWFSITGIAAMNHGIIWTITPDEGTSAEQVFAETEKTHILANPFADRRYIYED